MNLDTHQVKQKVLLHALDGLAADPGAARSEQAAGSRSSIMSCPDWLSTGSSGSPSSARAAEHSEDESLQIKSATEFQLTQDSFSHLNQQVR